MSQKVAGKIGKGISPEQFIAGMEKNKDNFLHGYEQFAWPSAEDREWFESLNNRDDLRCLIIAADWCGDCVRNVPPVLKALEVTGMPVEIFIKEQHEDLLDDFLVLGGRSIPIVIIADTGGYVLGFWGPRPAHVQEAMVAFKQANPDREAADYAANLTVTREEMSRRYGEGLGYQAEVIRELRELLSKF
jgi:hypothetical protein